MPSKSAEMVKRLTGMRLRDYLHDRLFVPLSVLTHPSQLALAVKFEIIVCFHSF